MFTAESRRRSFPMLEEMVYLNSAAEGMPPLEVGEALAQYFRDKQLGMDGRERHFAALEETKSLVAELYGLTAAEIGICSCSSEAFNLAALAMRLREGDEVVVNDLDFPAGATPWLQPTCPATVRVWRARAGVLHVEDLAKLLTPKTRLVTVSLSASSTVTWSICQQWSRPSDGIRPRCSRSMSRRRWVASRSTWPVRT